MKKRLSERDSNALSTA